ncbi:hypothetical protein VNO78_06394 [Psophocarpus tetragonolobus]|uniref:Bet v I/Major latex protein domain-containing protein n=1 Tax=Psophocarpus tetragonolobus TaxID=3891 RepID=A0AAN9ST34_PSOTE
MIKEIRDKTEVSVGLKTLWQALTKDLTLTLVKVMSNVVKDVKVIEGDGGNGTIFLITFFSDVTPVSVQKKITDLDENSHEFEKGFSFYKTSFQLSAIEEHKTLVNVKISYDYELDTEGSAPPLKTAEFALSFIRRVEPYLLNDALVQDS